MNLPTDFPSIPAGLRGNDPQFSVPYLCSTRTKKKNGNVFLVVCERRHGNKTINGSKHESWREETPGGYLYLFKKAH